MANDPVGVSMSDLPSGTVTFLFTDIEGSTTRWEHQSDAMRVRRKQLAEERAAKTAVKILLPLVFFIFPGIFVVLLGPAAIQIIQTMFNGS